MPQSRSLRHWPPGGGRVAVDPVARHWHAPPPDAAAARESSAHSAAPHIAGAGLQPPGAAPLQSGQPREHLLPCTLTASTLPICALCIFLVTYWSCQNPIYLRALSC